MDKTKTAAIMQVATAIAGASIAFGLWAPSNDVLALLLAFTSALSGATGMTKPRSESEKGVG